MEANSNHLNAERMLAQLRECEAGEEALSPLPTHLFMAVTAKLNPPNPPNASPPDDNGRGDAFQIQLLKAPLKLGEVGMPLLSMLATRSIPSPSPSLYSDARAVLPAPFPLPPSSDEDNHTFLLTLQERFPRGLSLDLFSLPTSSAPLALEYRPSPLSSALLTSLCNEKEGWELREVRHAQREADPATAVRERREKLREVSGKRVGSATQSQSRLKEETEEVKEEERRKSLALLEEIMGEGKKESSSSSSFSNEVNESISPLFLELIAPLPKSFIITADNERSHESDFPLSAEVKTTERVSRFDSLGANVVMVEGTAVELTSIEVEDMTSMPLIEDEEEKVFEKEEKESTVFLSEEEEYFASSEEKKKDVQEADFSDDLDRLLALKTSAPLKAFSPSEVAAGNSTWASRTYLPNAEFDRIRPRLALPFPFELDVFQKQVSHLLLDLIYPYHPPPHDDDGGRR